MILDAHSRNLLVVSFGGRGDVYPLLGLAIALRERGHRVRFVSSEKYSRLAAEYGIESIACPPNQKRSQRGRLGGWLYQSLSRQGHQRRAYIDRMRWLYDLVSREPDPRRTVIITRTNSFGARLAQEKLGTSVVTIQLQPSGFRSIYDAPGLPLPAFAGTTLRRALWFAMDIYYELTITPYLNDFRSELGLPNVHRPLRGWCYSPDLVIGMFPDWFGSPQLDWPANSCTTGFALFDESSNQPAPADLESFLNAGPPPIVFTRGSQSQGERAFFETCIEICRRSGHRGILLAPRNGSIPDSLPDCVRHYEFVPLSKVLPRSRAIVHHGGVGTAALALAAGTPQLVVPLFDDQPDNAARVQRLGVGFRLAPGAFDAVKAGDCLQELLSSDEVSKKCRALSQLIKNTTPIADTCKLIEDRMPT